MAKELQLTFVKKQYIVDHTFGVINLRKIPGMVNFISACAVLYNMALTDDFALEQNDSQEN